ncbi:Na+/H+ antiporter NhaC [Moraxella nasovis]|uniref:Na+/H+ antiporter NhaC n=1 Tax=Moraxella nasovis TaxID=2904121 RepID=UPI001F60D830|nr:Na+/H+ antiporter NhaC [Moraxella nasovis]UNU74045.1 Na+/H+ antiporter NhaC [Moraxella nasovis]
MYSNFNKTKNVNITTPTAMIMATAMIAVMAVVMIALGWIPHLALLLVICGVFLFGYFKGLDFSTMQDYMAKGVMSGFGAIYLFFFIGLMVSALMMSGAIPTLMYYGFELISPQYFYVSAFILTSIIGVAIGSSLTTCATIGVAFMGMAGAFDANTAIVAGAVVSGAFFGDKMSPLSDTCTISASVAGIDLFEHIGNMTYTTVPAWILTVVLLWFLQGQNAGADLSQVGQLKEQLVATGLVQGYALLPFALLVGLILFKVNAIYAIIMTIISAVMITFFHSSPTLSEIGSYFFQGYKPAENLELGAIGSLISRGGLNSMFFTQTIVILALSLGGLLHNLGILPALLNSIKHKLINAGQVTLAVALTSLGVNVLIGEQYLSILLAAESFKTEYTRLNLHPKNLARTIEDAGTVINPLVPWSVCGVFISEQLGVSVLAYLPYAFFCYLCLFLTIIFGFTGFTITKLPSNTTNQA